MRHNFQKISKEKRNKVKDWFQSNLKAIRILSGLTLADIAKNTGISIQTLSLLEKDPCDKDRREIKYYQYLVIRQYIKSYLTAPLRYGNTDSSDSDDFNHVIINPILSIAIDIICNDMEIWSSKEQTYISTQWELIKEDIIKTEKAKTAKTYSKVFSEQFPNVVNPGYLINSYATLDFFRIATAMANASKFNVSTDKNEFDYTCYIEANNTLSPIEKIVLFIILGIVFIGMFALPLDEVLSKLHIRIHKSTLEIINKLSTIQSVDSKPSSDSTSPISTHFQKPDEDTLKEMMSLFEELMVFDTPEDNSAPIDDKLNKLFEDWIMLARTALLKMVDLNDWVYATTIDGVEDLTIYGSSKSFIIYLFTIYEDRADRNINKLHELLPDYFNQTTV